MENDQLRNYSAEKSLYTAVVDRLTLTATPKSHVSLRTPQEYFYYSKHIMAK